MTLFEGTTSLGTATTTAGGAWSIPLTGVADGVHTYTATATDAATNTSPASAGRTITVDKVRPLVSSTVPTAGASAIAVGANVTATFSEAMTAASLTTTSFSLAPTAGGSAVPASVAYNAATQVATLDPSAALVAGVSYTATITTAAADLAGNTLLAAHTWTFTTAPAADTTPPTVSSRTPAAAATNVGVSTNVTATFSEPVTGVSGTSFTLEGPGTTPVGAVVTYDGPSRTATLNPSADLAANTTYTARLTGAISDTAATPNALAPLSWTFTTAPAADTTPPTVSSRTPAAAATNVGVSTNVTATFSEPVTGVSGTSFTLEGPGTTPVGAVVTYDGPSRTATLNPSADLAANTTYTARLTGAISDTAATPNALAPLSWTFTTAAAPPPGAITFRSASSAANATATTLVLPTPAGVVSGDVLLASVAARGGPAITPPAGWTLVRLDPNGSTLRQAVYVHVAGGAEPATYTFTLASAQSASGGISAYTGVDPTTPIDAHGGQVAPTSTSISAPSITTSGPDRMLVGFFATAVLTSVTPPAGQTERFDQAVPSTNTFKITAAAADGIQAATGASGPRTATSANSGVNVGALVALRPGAGGPPPPDTTPPTVSSRTPLAAATNVGVSTNVTATFSEPVTGVSGTSFTLEGPGTTPVGAVVTYDGPSRTATLNPSADLAANTTYTARLTGAISDTAATPNALAPLSWTFTTAPAADTTPPTVSSRTPAAAATNVGVSTNVTATFSEPVTGVSGTSFTLEGPGTTPVGAVVTYDGPSRTATLNPSADLAANTTYTARLTGAISDTAATPNALAPLSWTFTTAPAADTTPPTVSSRTPPPLPRTSGSAPT